MPRQRRGKGFSTEKSGRFKLETGGQGQGTRGTQAVSKQSPRKVLVGELDADDTIEAIFNANDSSDSNYSNQSEALRAALLSPTPSASGQDSRCTTPQSRPETPSASGSQLNISGSVSPVFAQPMAPKSIPSNASTTSTTISVLKDLFIAHDKKSLPH